MPETIKFYIREEPYGWLSNFERAPQRMGDGVTYPTNEHYYQATKAADSAIRRWIGEAPTAWHAMKAGRALKERDITVGWNDSDDPVKLHVMLEGLRAKFGQNPSLAEKLLATGDAILQESPKGGFTDSFWGNTQVENGQPGASHLGNLLMKVREEMRSKGDTGGKA